MKVAVVGGVNSTATLVKKLAEHSYTEVKVWGYSPNNKERVSGWADLNALCKELQFDHSPFLKVEDCAQDIINFQPEIIFAVGLSQLIPERIIEAAKYGCIGFHPTKLPKGRGRAPIAWLVLESQPGAANFFFIRRGVDDGPILERKEFSVTEEDNASTVEEKLLAAESMALDSLLPRLAAGDFSASEQDHSVASWYGRRAPEDGLINWHLSAEKIVRLIRASTTPHPGAFTYEKDSNIIIWEAKTELRAENGVIGRILSVDSNNGFLVQCGEGLVRVLKWTSSDSWNPRVGQMLGYYVESEVHNLRAQVFSLTERLTALEGLLRNTPN